MNEWKLLGKIILTETGDESIGQMLENWLKMVDPLELFIQSRVQVECFDR